MKKRIFTLVICFLLIFGVIYKLDDIVSTLTKYLDSTPKLAALEVNKYSKKENYEYVQISDTLIPYNYQELINVFYTILDSGYDTYTFYCPIEYSDCINDVHKISSPNNIETLTTIGNYVAPFNNFTSLKVQYDTAGEVTVYIKHLYTEDEINQINNKIDQIWNEIVKDDMEPEDIIYAFHDYIINNTKYDDLYEQELKTGKTTHQSNKANGPLFEGYGICSGYTDVMALILNRLNIKNYKIASDTHVWNALYINNEWVHLDLTWDDPVSENHDVNNLLHKFYLIDTNTLKSFDIKDHNFNKANYIELK